jgi:hypothetical protein
MVRFWPRVGGLIPRLATFAYLTYQGKLFFSERVKTVEPQQWRLIAIGMAPNVSPARR